MKLRCSAFLALTASLLLILIPPLMRARPPREALRYTPSYASSAEARERAARSGRWRPVPLAAGRPIPGGCGDLPVGATLRPAEGSASLRSAVVVERTPRGALLREPDDALTLYPCSHLRRRWTEG